MTPTNEAREREVKECPFCGNSKHLAAVTLLEDRNKWTVFCEECATEGPVGKSIEEAEEKWNARPAPPPAQAGEVTQRRRDAADEILRHAAVFFRTEKRRAEIERDFLQILANHFPDNPPPAPLTEDEEKAIQRIAKDAESFQPWEGDPWELSGKERSRINAEGAENSRLKFLLGIISKLRQQGDRGKGGGKSLIEALEFILKHESKNIGCVSLGVIQSALNDTKIH